MGEKRIIAHFMHETEQVTAESLMTNTISTESYVIGLIDDTKVQELEEGGLIIQEIPDKPSIELDDLSPALANARVTFESERMLPEFDPSQPNIYTISLAGPLIEAWRDELAKTGVKIIEAIGGDRYTARLDPQQVSAIGNLNFVSNVRVHTETETSPPLPTSRTGPLPRTGIRRMMTFDIRLHDPSDGDAIAAWLRERNVEVAGVRGRKIRVFLMEDSPALSEIDRLPEVYQILEYVPPELANDRARVLVGLEEDGNPRASVINFDGTGQIVGVADSGIDDSHPDLQNHIAGISALGRPNDHSDTNGHGTHVAGSIAGDGSASNGQIRGTAPNASLYFQSIMDARGELNGLPWDLNDLFDEAYQAGARIHNNSWGANTNSRYTFNSIEADEFTANHRDMLIVIAAGNKGTARDPFSTKKGFVDWLSVNSPATAKNALTVGASRSDRDSGGLSGLTWSQAWPGDFPDAPIGTENVSGDPAAMAAFSSRGPCDDRRIKPDVVAPGTNIVSAKSSRAPLANFWGSFPGHSGRYAFLGGTSMATPIVSGCLALIRQFYVEERGHDPSAALLKATIINGTRKLDGRDATAEFADLPNFHQGFGCVHMPTTIPNDGQSNLQLEFLDPWRDDAKKLTRTGQRSRFRIGVADGRELRICLAWTDIPARALQNNLNLFVQSFANGEKWVGNRDLPMKITRLDSENNVEAVRIATPPAGDYLIQITASNLLSSQGQDFALVVTGNLTSGISTS